MLEIFSKAGVPEILTPGTAYKGRPGNIPGPFIFGYIRGNRVKTVKIAFNHTNIDLRDLEQLIDPNQTNTICFMIQYMIERVVNMALPRKHEIAGTLNRFRSLKIKQSRNEGTVNIR